MEDVTAKFKSDRLWALLGFLALLVSNAMFDIGLTEDQMTDALWATIAFIGGKSLRSTTGGTIFDGAISMFAGRGLASIEAIVPDVPEDSE